MLSLECSKPEPWLFFIFKMLASIYWRQTPSWEFIQKNEGNCIKVSQCHLAFSTRSIYHLESSGIPVEWCHVPQGTLPTKDFRSCVTLHSGCLYLILFYLLNLIICNLHNSLLVCINRCGIPKELTALIGMIEKAGDMKVTVEVTNGRGDRTVVRKRTDIVNHITSLKNLIGKLLLN